MGFTSPSTSSSPLFIKSNIANRNIGSNSNSSSNSNTQSSILHKVMRKRSTPSSNRSTSNTSVIKASSSSSNEIEKTENNDSNNNDEMGILSILGFVLPLLLVYISNQWSRASLYYLVDFSSEASSPSSSSIQQVQQQVVHDASYYAMNLDIGFDQAQYGALASVAFTTLFAITSLFAGSLADKYNRKYLSISSTILWSIATYTTSIATTYDEILIARVIMGLACAFTTPCAYTLLKDVVSNSKLSFANSIYGSGVYFGGGLSSLSILLDQNFGWRYTCEIIAVYGFGVALLTSLVLPNDPKDVQVNGVNGSSTGSSNTIKSAEEVVAVEDEESNSFLNDVQDVISTNKRIQWLFLGSFLRFCSGLCIGVWAAPYYKLAFPNDATSYAVINALIVGLCGVSSGLLGGYLSDQTSGLIGKNDDMIDGGNDELEQKRSSLSTLYELDENGARLIVPIVGSILAVPTWWLTCHASTFDTAMFWLAIEYLVAECWFGPTVAVLQSEVKKGQGGVAQGLFTLTGAIGNLAPSVLGVLYSQQMIGDTAAVSGNEALSNLLGVGVCAGYLLSAFCFGLSATASSTKSTQKNIAKIM